MPDPLGTYTIEQQNQELARLVLENITLGTVYSPAFNLSETAQGGVLWIKAIILLPPPTVVTATDYLGQGWDISDLRKVLWVGVGAGYDNNSTVERAYQETYLVPVEDREFAPKRYVDDAAVSSWTAGTLELGVTGTFKVRTENGGKTARLQYSIARGGGNIGNVLIGGIGGAFRPIISFVGGTGINKTGQDGGYHICRVSNGGEVTILNGGATQNCYGDFCWVIN